MFPFMAQFAFPQQPQQQQQQQPQAGTSTAGQRNDDGNSAPQMPSSSNGFSMPQFPATSPGFPFMVSVLINKFLLIIIFDSFRLS